MVAKACRWSRTPTTPRTCSSGSKPNQHAGQQLHQRWQLQQHHHRGANEHPAVIFNRPLYRHNQRSEPSVLSGVKQPFLAISLSLYVHITFSLSALHVPLDHGLSVPHTPSSTCIYSLLTPSVTSPPFFTINVHAIKKKKTQARPTARVSFVLFDSSAQVLCRVSAGKSCLFISSRHLLFWRR